MSLLGHMVAVYSMSEMVMLHQFMKMIWGRSDTEVLTPRGRCSWYCGSLRIYQPYAFGSRNCATQESTCCFLKHYIHTSCTFRLLFTGLGILGDAINDPQQMSCLDKSILNFLSATFLWCTAPVLCNFCI